MNAYKKPMTTFIVGDMDKIKFVRLMASAIREGFVFENDNGFGIQGMSSDNYLFGLWCANICRDRNAVVSAVKQMFDYVIDYDCYVFAYKTETDNCSNKVGIVTQVVGMNDDGEYVDVSNHDIDYKLDMSEWTIVYTATELAEKILAELEPFLSRAREWDAENKRKNIENRVKVAELKRIILDAQNADRPIDNKVLDPNEWWESLSDEEKATYASK
jgi:hypothetical protein